jgi:hypothetical protein
MTSSRHLLESLSALTKKVGSNCTRVITVFELVLKKATRFLGGL